MEVKPGYKQTEVGVIPEEWEVRSLGTLATMVASGRSRVAAACGSYPVHGSTGVIGYTEKPDYEGDVILAARVGANAGKLNLVSGQYGVTDNTIMVRLSSGCCLPFFWRQLESKRLNSLVFGSGQPLITGTQLKALPLGVPPLPEQRAIAGVLSDVDALIGALDSALAKKRDLKQAAMQQLLTPPGAGQAGQKRLPGFHGEWQNKPLGDLISHCFSGATPRRIRHDYFKGDIRWITSGELNYNMITDTAEKISSEAAARTNLKIVPKGTFLMAITGLEAEGTRGSCGIVGEPSTTNQSCMAIFPTSDLVTAYLFHYYVLRGEALAFQYCQGTKQQSYTAKLVKQLPIALPPTTTEQTAIAEVLSDMDVELAALTQRRDKTRALKQGMMQELLTGRIRLV
jgi:type I restriction enzyme S subunit